jgi:hypothetical protein
MLRTRISTGITRSLPSRLGLASHHRRPYGHADRLATLVDAVVLEGHDAGVRPGP